MDGDAGSGQLNSADSADEVGTADSVGSADAASSVDEDVPNGDVAAADVPVADAAESESAEPDVDSSTPVGSPSRLNGRWAAAVVVLLVVLAGGLGAGGYLAMRAHQRSAAIESADNEALAAAKDCVAATQAPDPSAMLASQQKIYDCMTGDYAVQSGVLVGVIADAYQVAQAKVEVGNLRAAVEDHLDDGTVQVLVAIQVKISTAGQQDNVTGYRLRALMAPADGTWKIARLDPVSS